MTICICDQLVYGMQPLRRRGMILDLGLVVRAFVFLVSWSMVQVCTVLVPVIMWPVGGLSPLDSVLDSVQYQKI